MTVTVIGGGGLELPPPQATINPRSMSETHERAIAVRFDTLRRTRPSITTATMGNLKGSHGERWGARCRNSGPIPGFGPLVVIVNETGVAPVVPAAIDGGVKTQLLFVSVVSVGEKVQPNVTGLVKVADPDVGVAMKLYGIVFCPARTLCEVSVVAHVKVGAATVTVTAEEVEEAFVPT